MSELSHFEQSMTRTNISNALHLQAGDQPPTAISQMTRRAASLRDRLSFINLDVAELHENSLQLLLDEETDERVKTGLPYLLAELTEEYGLGWSDIARLVRVSVPAIRKWRNGGEITPVRLYALARLSAFMRILRQQGFEDPAVWLATPLSEEIDRSITKASLYADGHAVHLLAYADHHINLEQLLKTANVPPENRHVTADLVRGEDGSTSIVPIGS